MEGFDYIASPYTDPDPLVREQRYLKVSELVVVMLRNGIFVYSPIAHCHEMAKIWGLPHDAAFWKAYDTEMIRACRHVSIYMLPGWDKSVGVRGEIDLAIELGKTITYIAGGGSVESAVEVYRRSPKSAA